MKKTHLLMSLLAAALASSAHAAVKPCDELKTEISTKLETNGVKNFKLDIVAADKVGDAKVLGSCNGGTEKITFEKVAVDKK